MKKIRAHRGLRHYCACHARPPLLLPRRMPAADRRRRVRRSQGVCACVASAQRPRAARAAPSVSPRKRARRAPPLLTTRARRGRVAPRGRALSSSHTRFYCYALLQPSAISHAACYASERGIPSLVVCDLVGLCILSFSESNPVSRQTRVRARSREIADRIRKLQIPNHCSLIEWSEIAVSKTRNRAGHRRTTFTTCLSSAARVDGLARRARARCSFHRGRGRAR